MGLILYNLAKYRSVFMAASTTFFMTGRLHWGTAGVTLWDTGERGERKGEA